MADSKASPDSPVEPPLGERATAAGVLHLDEWAISTIEPSSTISVASRKFNAENDDVKSTEHRAGRLADNGSGRHELLRPNVSAHKKKRGSSETRSSTKASLVAEQKVLNQRTQTGLQELRNEIDILKAAEDREVKLGGVTSGTSISASFEAGPDIILPPARDEGKTLPSPPPSVAAASPLLLPVDKEEVEEEDLLAVKTEDVIGMKGDGSARLRASSSALDFGAPFEPRPMPDPTIVKERAASASARPQSSARAQSTPVFRRKASAGKPPGVSAVPSSKTAKDHVPSAKTDRSVSKSSARHDANPPSPMADMIPLPPFSMHSFLQLELSSQRPSPLYLQRSSAEPLYEPTSVKVERLLNFLLLPPQLERVLWFGAIACVDAWLYNFTILPIRFCSAILKLTRSLIRNLWAEIKFVVDFVPHGLSRVWHRQLGQSEAPTPVPTPVPEGESWPSASSQAQATSTTSSSGKGAYFPIPQEAQVKATQQVPRMSRPKLRRHRRTRSVASSLMSSEKADILKGFLIISSTVILMRFDASMMYHSIRGQAAIKLYVIYNVLEVFDRLFSAIGQDILECLFSPESLSRHPNGRSKILRPLSLFPLALVYVLIHATALYYQVITLNVAVNSYSNALLTLLMSNQFVEIKSTVFKRIEKENLFQMTCADVAERFQLWLMLMIIASRNIIETSASMSTNSSSSTTSAPPPTTPTLLPFSFTIFPSLSLGQILNPFILVLGTETLVDWLKHAYVSKFNNVKPNVYGRFLDILAKDYYSNAFQDPNLTRRIGLPVLPLTCLATRAAVQTYHMAREQLGPPSRLPVPGTSVDDTGPDISPTTAAVLRHIDSLFLRVVGGGNAQPGPNTVGELVNGTVHASSSSSSTSPLLMHSTHSAWWLPSSLITRLTPSWLPLLIPDLDMIWHAATSAVLILAIWLVLLAAKLALSMLLLRYARGRYDRMQARERESSYQEGRRHGPYGIVEIDEERRRWIYADDPQGLKKVRDREKGVREREGLDASTGASTSVVAGLSQADIPIGGIPTAGRTGESVEGGVDKEGLKEATGASTRIDPAAGRDTAAVSSQSAATSSSSKKWPNYDVVERYKLGGSKRIW